MSTICFNTWQYRYSTTYIVEQHRQSSVFISRLDSYKRNKRFKYKSFCEFNLILSWVKQDTINMEIKQNYVNRAISLFFFLPALSTHDSTDTVLRIFSPATKLMVLSGSQHIPNATTIEMSILLVRWFFLLSASSLCADLRPSAPPFGALCAAARAVSRRMMET